MNYARDALRPHTVYRFFDAAGALLYIGCSSDWYSRCKGHGSTKEWWDQITTITLARYPEMAPAVAAEAEAIRTEKPQYCIQHTTPRCKKCGGPRERDAWGIPRCKPCKSVYAKGYYHRIGKARYQKSRVPKIGSLSIR